MIFEQASWLCVRLLVRVVNQFLSLLLCAHKHNHRMKPLFLTLLLGCGGSVNGVTLPHILLVVADDLGYNDVGSVSNSIQRTKVLSLELKELKELYD